MNDERPIEKLLRRYAEKRRDEAGAPVELHPATRRLLQGEVTRQFPRRAAASDGEPTTFAKILVGWRTRWVWALPVLVVLGVAVWALVGPKEEPGHGFDLAKSAPATAAPAEVVNRSFKALETPASVPAEGVVKPASQPALTYAERAPARDKREMSSVSVTSAGARFGARLDGAPVRRKGGDATSVNGLAAFRTSEPGLKLETESLRANEFAQTAPADQSGSQVSVEQRALAGTTRPGSDKQIQVSGLAFLPPDKGDSVENFGKLRKEYVAASENAPARAPIRTPPVFAPEALTSRFSQEARGGGVLERGQAVSQAFANRAPVSGYETIAKSAPLTPVLANFRIEQTGNQLRVIDGDGSTYLGETQLPAATPTTAVAFEKKGAAELKAGDETSTRQVAQAGLTGQKDAQRYFAYRAEGTNRTLKQQVVFTWNFLPLTNTVAATPAKSLSGGGNVWENNAPVQQFLLLNNSVINGRAQLGGAKEIEINAVPVTP